jgi:hypothetical protein
MLVYLRYRPEELMAEDSDVINGVFDLAPADLEKLYAVQEKVEPNGDVLDISTVTPGSFSSIAKILGNDDNLRELVA